MNRRVLFVDDESNVLEAFERQFHRRFEMFTAQGPARALAQLEQDAAFAVVVSDLRMPGMDGIQFLRRVREKWPDTVRIMLTGQADLTATIAAVNHGNVFQFLTKPCPAEMLGRALDSAIDQHQLITAERELLEQTLRGSIGVMSEILSLVNPVAFGKAGRVRRYVLHIARQMELETPWKYEVAAMLSQIGYVAVPPDVLNKYQDELMLTPAEKDILSAQKRIAHKLLSRIPRLEEVAEIIAGRPDVQDRPASNSTVKIGWDLLRSALEFDELIMHNVAPDAALERMRQHNSYPPEMLDALAQAQVERAAEEVKMLRINQLRPGMITNCKVYSRNGLLILGTGQEITESGIARLLTFGSTVGIDEPISMRVPCMKPLHEAEMADVSW